VRTESTEVCIAILVFGSVSLLAVAVIQVSLRRGMTKNFVKLFGLLFIGTVAGAITFTGIDSGTRTGAYTILGTIAGYLAGGKIETGPADGGSSDDRNRPSRVS
jgi:hypothetical protein